MNKTSQIYIGFDFGLARIGAAHGHALTGVCSPLKTLANDNNRPDWEGIQALLDEWQPEAVIVGVPLHMDGSPTSVTEKAQRFARQIRGRFGYTVHTADERLSSREAETHLKQLRQQGRKKRIQKTDIDSAAAAIILQRWFEENAL